MSDPRKHHFLPVCYLKGFTADNSKSGRLYVFDLQSGKRFLSSPRKVGHQKDLYKLDVPKGVDAFFIERVISEKIEGPFAIARDSIVSRRSLPPRTSEEWNAVLNFIALLAVRVPATLDAVEWFSSRFFKEQLREMSQDPGRFEHIKKSLSEEGIPLGTLGEFREGIRHLDSGDIAVDLDRNYLLLDLMVKAMDDFLHAIARRPWRLLIADDRAPDLICSDRPVIISTPQTNPRTGRLEARLRCAHLTFPLTRRMWLTSNFGFDAECAQECGTWTVAAANRRIARYADRFLFSPNPVFTYAGGKKKLRESSDLAHLLKHGERRVARAFLGSARS